MRRRIRSLIVAQKTLLALINRAIVVARELREATPESVTSSHAEKLPFVGVIHRPDQQRIYNCVSYGTDTEFFLPR